MCRDEEKEQTSEAESKCQSCEQKMVAETGDTCQGQVTVENIDENEDDDEEITEEKDKEYDWTYFFFVLLVNSLKVVLKCCLC